MLFCASLTIERTVSPGWMLPPRTASSSASGMEAALVLPYSARLLITRSGATCRQISAAHVFQSCVKVSNMCVP